METKATPAELNLIDPSGRLTEEHFAAARRQEIFTAIDALARIRRDAGDVVHQVVSMAFINACAAVVDALGRLPLPGEFAGDVVRLIKFGKLLYDGLRLAREGEGWEPGPAFASALDDVLSLPQRINSRYAIASKPLEKFADLVSQGLNDDQITRITGMDLLDIRAERAYVAWAQSPFRETVPEDKRPASITEREGYRYPIINENEKQLAKEAAGWLPGDTLSTYRHLVRQVVYRGRVDELVEA